MLLQANQHKKMIWKNGGGITQEIDRAPSDNNNEEFDWRISIASIKPPGGPFSIFPQIDRTLCIIDGKHIQLKLINNNNQLIYLDENSPPYSFPGEISITSQVDEETITDFNVMTKRDKFRHTVQRIVLTKDQSPMNISNTNEEIIFIVIARGNLKVNGITMVKCDAIKFNDTNNQKIQIESLTDDTIFYLVTIINLLSPQ